TQPLTNPGGRPRRRRPQIVEKRRHPAHPPVRDRFNEPVIIFLTVCSKDRKPLFALADSVGVIIEAWRRAESWSVGRYVVMPDHLHPFCAPAVFPIEPLMQWVRYWKSIASRNWHVHTNSRSGNAISGTRSCGVRKITIRNGSTSWTTPSARDWHGRPMNCRFREN